MQSINTESFIKREIKNEKIRKSKLTSKSSETPHRITDASFDCAVCGETAAGV